MSNDIWKMIWHRAIATFAFFRDNPDGAIIS